MANVEKVVYELPPAVNSFLQTNKRFERNWIDLLNTHGLVVNELYQLLTRIKYIDPIDRQRSLPLEINCLRERYGEKVYLLLSQDLIEELGLDEHE